MVDEKILKYVKENFKKGFTLEEIRKGLLAQKLPMKTIDECIGIVTQFQDDLKIKKGIWPFIKSKKSEKKTSEVKKPLKQPNKIPGVNEQPKPKRHSKLYLFFVKPLKKLIPKKGKSFKKTHSKKPKPKFEKPPKPIKKKKSIEEKPRSKFAPPIKKKKSFPYWIKVFLGVLFAVGFIILFLFLLTKYSPPPKKYVTISEFKLTEGVYLEVFQESEVNFTFANQDYHIFIKEINSKEGYVKILGFMNQTFWEAKERYFNLDDDMEEDLIFQLENISEDKVATFYLKAISDFVCPENWNCTDWSPCSNGTQKRVCIDMNSCGTSRQKPATQKTCISGRKTYFSKDNKTNFIFDCGIEENYLVNDCLIESSVNCSNSKLIGSSEINNSGYILKLIKYLEIKGYENGKCLFYQKDLTHSLDYSDALIQDLLDQGYSMEEIQTMKQEDNASVQDSTGLWSECGFEVENLTTLLTNWKIGDYSSGLDCEVLEGIPVNCSYYGFFENIGCSVGIIN